MAGIERRSERSPEQDLGPGYRVRRSAENVRFCGLQSQSKFGSGPEAPLDTELTTNITALSRFRQGGLESRAVDKLLEDGPDNGLNGKGGASYGSTALWDAVRPHGLHIGRSDRTPACGHRCLRAAACLSDRSAGCRSMPIWRQPAQAPSGMFRSPDPPEGSGPAARTNLRVFDRALDRARSGSIHDRRHPARRRRAVVACDRADQSLRRREG